jgi:hypothetical protein
LMLGEQGGANLGGARRAIITSSSYFD